MLGLRLLALAEARGQLGLLLVQERHLADGERLLLASGRGELLSALRDQSLHAGSQHLVVAHHLVHTMQGVLVRLMIDHRVVGSWCHVLGGMRHARCLCARVEHESVRICRVHASEVVHVRHAGGSGGHRVHIGGVEGSHSVHGIHGVEVGEGGGIHYVIHVCSLCMWQACVSCSHHCLKVSLHGLRLYSGCERVHA